MPGPTRSTTRYAAGLVAAVALAGCGTGGEAPAAQTPVATSSAAAGTSAVTPSATPSTAVDPVLARIPAAARPETMEGAAAFVEFYFEQVNLAFRTANAEALTGLTGGTCQLCVSMAQGVSDMASRGRHYGGDLAKVNYATPMDFTATSRRVLIDADQLKVNVLDKSGRTVDTTSQARLRFVATMQYDGRWTITRLQKAKS